MMVNLSSPGEQTSLDLSVRTDIVVGVRYNVTMVAQNALGPSEQSDSILVTKQAGKYQTHLRIYTINMMPVH